MQRTRGVPARTETRTSISLTKEELETLRQLATRAYNGDMEEAALIALGTGLTTLLRLSHNRIHNHHKKER